MLTPAQIDTYREKGYLVIEDAIPASTIDRLKALTQEFVDHAVGVPGHDDVYDVADGHTAEAPLVRRIKLPHKAHPEFRQFAADPVLTDIMADLLGSDVRLHGGKINLKPGKAEDAVEWHQDWAFYPHTNDDLLAVGVMLDDMDLENGPILMLPETHRGPVYSHHAEGKFSGAIDLDTCDLDFSKVETVTGRAGSISVHHVRLVHGSSANRSGKPRRLLLWEYAAADAWPLMGAGDLEEFNERVVRGRPTLTPRLEDVPVRIPLPPALHPGSIFENQRAAAHRFFDEADTRQAAYS